MEMVQLDLFGSPRSDSRPSVGWTKRITLKNGKILIAPPGRAFPIRESLGRRRLR